MLANMKKKLSFIILSIISIFIFSSCSGEKEIEIKDLVLNECYEYRADVKSNEKQNVIYHFISSDKGVYFLSINKSSYMDMLNISLYQKKDKEKEVKLDFSSENFESIEINNYLVFNHTLYDDSDIFYSFSLDKDYEYYISLEYVGDKKSKPYELAIRYEILVFSDSFYDAEADVVDATNISKAKEIYRSENASSNYDFRLIEFVPIESGLYSFELKCVSSNICIDYSMLKPRGLSIDDIICTFLTSYDDSNDGYVYSRFELYLYSDKTVYFRFRSDDLFSDFSPFWFTIFKIM